MISFMFSVNSVLERVSISMAAATSSMSKRTPRSLISWSMWYSSQTCAGTGNFASLCWMPISVSTSRILYFLNMAHLSGAWKGRFLVRCPLVFVGAQGWQKYLMRSFPSESFCFSRPRTAPTPSKESGSPIVAAHIMEQRQLSGSRYSPVG